MEDLTKTMHQVEHILSVLEKKVEEWIIQTKK